MDNLVHLTTVTLAKEAVLLQAPLLSLLQAPAAEKPESARSMREAACFHGLHACPQARGLAGMHLATAQVLMQS